MKEKTPEEIKAAVCAYFDDNFPKGEYISLDRSIPISAFRSLIATTTFGVGFDLLMDNNQFNQIWTCSEWPSDMVEWLLIYRILGLEARELREELEAEKAASAKLVEALEEIRSGATDITGMDSSTFRRVSFDISDGALEAHKKGGDNVAGK